MGKPARTVRVVDILGVAETQRLAGGITRATLRRWRAHPEHPFPKPMKRLASGELWDRQDVLSWLAEHRPD